VHLVEKGGVNPVLTVAKPAGSRKRIPSPPMRNPGKKCDYSLLKAAAIEAGPRPVPIRPNGDSLRTLERQLLRGRRRITTDNNR